MAGRQEQLKDAMKKNKEAQEECRIQKLEIERQIELVKAQEKLEREKVLSIRQAYSKVLEEQIEDVEKRKILEKIAQQKEFEKEKVSSTVSRINNLNRSNTPNTKIGLEMVLLELKSNSKFHCKCYKTFKNHKVMTPILTKFFIMTRPTEEDPMKCPTDPSSFSNSHQVQTTHIHLDWSVDFKSQTISGTAEHSIKALQESSKIVLDCKGINVISACDSASGLALKVNGAFLSQLVF